MVVVTAVGRHRVCLRDLFDSRRRSGFGDNPAERKQGFLWLFLEPGSERGPLYLANGATDPVGGLCPKALPLKLVVVGFAASEGGDPKPLVFGSVLSHPGATGARVGVYWSGDATCHFRQFPCFHRLQKLQPEYKKSANG